MDMTLQMETAHIRPEIITVKCEMIVCKYTENSIYTSNFCHESPCIDASVEIVMRGWNTGVNTDNSVPTSQELHLKENTQIVKENPIIKPL